MSGSQGETPQKGPDDRPDQRPGEAPGETKGLWVRPGLVIPENELSATFTRSGGPGGQNVNKLNTRCSLRFSIRDSRVLKESERTWLLERLQSRLTLAGELIIHASTQREQRRNEREARQRLAEILSQALEKPKTRRKTRPTRGSKERRLSDKRRRSETKKGRKPHGRSED